MQTWCSDCRRICVKICCKLHFVSLHGEVAVLPLSVNLWSTMFFFSIFTDKLFEISFCCCCLNINESTSYFSIIRSVHRQWWRLPLMSLFVRPNSYSLCIRKYCSPTQLAGPCVTAWAFNSLHSSSPKFSHHLATKRLVRCTLNK